MNPPSTIPTPLAERWREFKQQALPGIVFAASVLAAVLLWRDYVTPVSLVGRVETVQASVASPKPGSLTQLRVTRFQPVVLGEPIAQIITTDPHILAASLAVIRAEVDLLRTDMVPVVDSQRNAINYEQLRLDWMQRKVELATARVQLQLAESELQRAETLFKDQLLPLADYEVAKSARDALLADISSKSELVATAEKSFGRLDGIQAATQDTQTQLRAAIAVQEEKLKLTEAEMYPITLLAPLDGLVSMIYRRNGENIAAGEPIITISAVQTDRIIGYLRQPLYLEPRTNMVVQVRTRGAVRQVGLGRILAVGAHLRPINEELMAPLKNEPLEVGLPISVSLPPGLQAHPGELVDLTILERAKADPL